MPQLIQKNPAFYQASEAVLKWRENTNQGTVARAAWWRLHAQCGMPGCLCCMPVAWHLIMPRNSPRSSFWQSTGQLLELCCSATHWPHGQPNQHSPGRPWLLKDKKAVGFPLKEKCDIQQQITTGKCKFPVIFLHTCCFCSWKLKTTVTQLEKEQNMKAFSIALHFSYVLTWAMWGSNGESSSACI